MNKNDKISMVRNRINASLAMRSTKNGTFLTGLVEKLNATIRSIARSNNARAALDYRVQRINTDADPLAEEAKKAAKQS